MLYAVMLRARAWRGVAAVADGGMIAEESAFVVAPLRRYPLQPRYHRARATRCYNEHANPRHEYVVRRCAGVAQYAVVQVWCGA